jgi:AGZA family xanthine/uracil permease-like MFS transporter
VATDVGARRAPQQGGNTGLLERVFHISERGSTLANEGRGGATTWLTMVYILVLNALIMGTVKDSTGHFLGGGTAPNLAAITAATALMAAILSASMGVVANFPLAMATGLGLNAFVTFTVAPQTTWANAMGLIVVEGIIMLVLVLTGVREKILNAAPMNLKLGIAAGIGLFLIFIGVVDGGFVHVGAGTPVQLGTDGELHGWPVAVFAIVLLAMLAMWAKGWKGFVLYGIIGGTILAFIVEKAFSVGSQTDATGKVVNPTGWSLNVPAWPDKVFSTPDFSTVFHISFGAFSDLGVVKCLVIIFTMLLSNLFDTVGTMTAVGAEGGLLDADGNPFNSKRILVVDSLGVAGGGLAGVSSNTAYIESGAGVLAGARTGLASVVTGVLFFVAMFFAPVAGIVPYEAAAPALVTVGIIMIWQVVNKGVFADVRDLIPVVLIMAFMAFTYSISVGIGAGFIGYVVVESFRGNHRRIHPVMWGLAVVFVVFFALSLIQGWLGVS